jgi:hypothetical protein
MYTDFEVLTYHFETPLSRAELHRALAPFGQVLDLGERGLRLIPHEEEWPVLYFNPDASVEVLTKDRYLDTVVSCVETLGRALGARVVGKYVGER